MVATTAGWRLTLQRISKVFQRRPLVTNVASFGILYVSAELTQQLVEKRLFKKQTEKQEATSLDWKAASRYAIIGTGGIGPVLFYWYRVLDRWVPGRAPRQVFLKCVVDQAISSPICIGIFFMGMSALEGKKDIFEEFRTKFWSTYMVSCCFWPTAQAINFGLLPAHTRVAFVGAASFLWCNILCLAKRRKIDDTDSEALVLPK